MKFARMTVLCFCIFIASESQAKDMCKLYANYTPLPDWYPQLCNKASGAGGSIRSAVGGAYSSFADAFSLNPAALPTMPLPLGVEIIASKPIYETTTADSTSNKRVSVNTIKGLTGVGFGIATDTDNSIFSNRANHTSVGSYSLVNTNSNTSAPTLPTITFANALALDKLFASAKSSWIPQIGSLFRYNTDIKNWSPGMGFSWSADPFSFGLSIIHEQAASSGYYPATTVYTKSFGLRVSQFQFEYTSITNATDYYESTVTIMALSGNVLGVMLTGAVRSDQSAYGGEARIYHFAAQYVFSPKLSLAYFYNYVPGFQSLAAQVLF